MEIFWYPAKRANDAANSENSDFVLERVVPVAWPRPMNHQLLILMETNGYKWAP